jgi:hypothetical protein
MPHGQDFQAIASDAVVDPVVDAIEIKTAHSGRARFLDGNSDVRLEKKKIEDSLEISGDGSGRGRSVGNPPRQRTRNLACCVT